MDVQTATKFTANQFRLMLVQKITARQINDHTWAVNSGTDPNRAYLVTAVYQRDVLKTTCTCRAGKLNQACKHALLVVREAQRDTRLLDATRVGKVAA